MPFLGMADSIKRAQKVFDHIDDQTSATGAMKPSVVILSNSVEPHLDASFFYLTGIPYGLFEGSYLIAKRDGSLNLLTTPLEEDIARAHSKGIEIQVIKSDDEVPDRLSAVIGSEEKLVGINSSELTAKSLETLKSALKDKEFVDVSPAFELARLVKDQSEIECIQKACDIASYAFKKIPSMLKQGVTESEVAAGIAFEMQKSGGSGVSFDSIVAFGKNSAQPHYSAGQAKLKSGQFVLCDYGTKYKRYCSDITRTLVYGKASKKQKQMYEVVKEAQELGTELCTPELTGAEVNSKVTEFIDGTEFKGRFIHSTGHSLGLAVHDGPGLSRNFTKKLIPGMVITVEPGVYLSEIGGVRIEDDVLITKRKPRILTSAKKDLIEVTSKPRK